MAEPQKRTKKIVFITIGILAFVIGIAVAGYIHTMQARARFEGFEVTFLTPQQAIVFWKTPGFSSVGYAKYGTNSSNRDTILEQTSSEPGEVHAVMIEDVPPEGVYVSIHDKNDDRWIVPEVHHIKYVATSSEGGI